MEFIEGDIEHIPLGNNLADVIISNCVLNLVPAKEAVIKEIFRVLKPGAHFNISDIVLSGNIPEQVREAAEMYAGCISGAIQKENYLQMISNKGFKNVKVQQEKQIVIPDDILSTYLSPEQITNFNSASNKVTSVNVYAEKPLEDKCCNTDCCKN